MRSLALFRGHGERLFRVHGRLATRRGISEEWDPLSRKCLVPTPYTFQATDLSVPSQTTPFMLDKVAGLVRVLADGATAVPTYRATLRSRVSRVAR